MRGPPAAPPPPPASVRVRITSLRSRFFIRSQEFAVRRSQLGYWLSFHSWSMDGDPNAFVYLEVSGLLIPSVARMKTEASVSTMLVVAPECARGDRLRCVIWFLR
ncbi:hypothetical protein OPV22_033567 [Ensete ventricosum]|uniref:Uncharacterized protein n=1 Tax=Ensete ventricosum TaxID=4639 RepID=A0AAV8P3G5_ENSVE|nr:hypothetical protein OPV22_033567 [Ensete ventricosum]